MHFIMTSVMFIYTLLSLCIIATGCIWFGRTNLIGERYWICSAVMPRVFTHPLLSPSCLFGSAPGFVSLFI